MFDFYFTLILSNPSPYTPITWLCDTKAFGSYVFYQPEDNGWFPFFGKYKQHFYFLAGIESGSIYNCRAAVRIHIDMSGYLLILSLMMKTARIGVHCLLLDPERNYRCIEWHSRILLSHSSFSHEVVEEMMIRSQNSMTRPSVMSLYLLMIAAIISVPPVLPFEEKAMPMPPPQKDAPMTHAMKGWSFSRWTPSVSCWMIGRKEVRVKTAKIVLMLNFHPKIRIASNNSRKLMPK